MVCRDWDFYEFAAPWLGIPIARIIFLWGGKGESPILGTAKPLPPQGVRSVRVRPWVRLRRSSRSLLKSSRDVVTTYDWEYNPPYHCWRVSTVVSLVLSGY